MTLDDLDSALQNLAGAVLRLHEVRQAMAARELRDRALEQEAQILGSLPRNMPPPPSPCTHQALTFDGPGVSCVHCGKRFREEDRVPTPSKPTQADFEAQMRAQIDKERLEQREALNPSSGHLVGSFRPSRRCPMTMDGKHVPEKVALDGTLRCERCYVGIHAE